MSNIYIGRPIYISDVRYLYPTSDIPDLALALALALAPALAEVGYCISDIGYRCRTSDIHIWVVLGTGRMAIARAIGQIFWGGHWEDELRKFSEEKKKEYCRD